METITNGQFSVAYDDKRMFAYSPNIITINKIAATLSSVDVVVSSTDTSEAVTFTLQFGGVGTSLNVDISRALRLFIGHDAEVSISGGGATATIIPYVINGARTPIENFGGAYSIRCWETYRELTIPVLFYGETTVYAEIGGSDVVVRELTTDNLSNMELTNVNIRSIRNGGKSFKVFVEGEMFSTGVWETANWVYNVTPACTPKNAMYVRWTDKQGLTWYWMFSVEDISIETKELIKYGKMPDTSIMDGAINTWSESRSKTIEKRAKIVATEVTSDEYKVLKTLASATIVDAYDDEADVWYRIRIANGSYEEVKGNYKDVEYEVEFASEQTQIG